MDGRAVALGNAALAGFRDQPPRLLKFGQCPSQELVADLLNLERAFCSRRVALRDRRDHLAQLSPG